METRKRWQTFLVWMALILTIYNILPTIIYYSKPLHKPINENYALHITQNIVERVNELEGENIAWVASFNKLLGIKAKKISIDEGNPQNLVVHFKNEADAATFRRYLPRAASFIDFYPASLSLSSFKDPSKPNSVYLERRIPVRFEPSQSARYFQYIPLWESESIPSAAFRAVTEDRALSLTNAVAGTSRSAAIVKLLLDTKEESRAEELALLLSSHLQEYENASIGMPALHDRLFASITQGDFEDRPKTLSRLIQKVSQIGTELTQQRLLAEKNLESLPQKDHFALQEMIAQIAHKEAEITLLSRYLNQYRSVIEKGKNPWSEEKIASILSEKKEDADAKLSLTVGGFNPVVKAISVDWKRQAFVIELHPDMQKVLQTASQEEHSPALQYLYSEMARITRESSEAFKTEGSLFTAPFFTLPDCSSLLSFDIRSLLQTEVSLIENTLKREWNPSIADFRHDNYPILSLSAWNKLSEKDRPFALVLYTPLIDTPFPMQGFKAGSIYVIAKGAGRIAARFSQEDQIGSAKLRQDITSLRSIMESYGAQSYPGTTYPLPEEYKDDLIFEISNAANSLLMATRESFKILGTGQLALLEMSNVAHRINVDNQIDNARQEELLKWRDEYRAATVDPNRQPQYEIPAPTQNLLWSNFVISFKKFFRGDERKVLKWGLDLSGGKSLLIALHDGQKLITSQADLDHGISELTERVNGMGVSEVAIRREGNFIALDFPGSTAISASELVQASSMSFHIVNEKFSLRNTALSHLVNQFLQEVWDQAVVTGQKDLASIERIAWNHLYGYPYDDENVQPQSESAKALYAAGLRLTGPKDSASSSFNDALSKVALFKGDHPGSWYGQNHPLLIVFDHFALKGSYLDHIRVVYDQKNGHTLAFDIKGKQILSSGEVINPREILYSWTSQFAQDRVASSPYADVTRGHGWRMAVILNDKVITAPELQSALRDSGQISGKFTQREIYRLKADLEAGSLSYTPTIISETVVSPELGFQERARGIASTLIALVAVMTVMITFYRFAGIIAAVAVVFDLFLIWATLQNLGATISLPGIAGVILTLGIAVDANVLVFERMREELAAGARLSTAIHKGYSRALTAIIDSNVTSLIAAVVLFQFDAGPIKAFALTLITGMAASLFTALFVTRTIFSRWLEKNPSATLQLRSWIPKTDFNFFKWAPRFLTISLGVILIASALFIPYRHRMLGLDFTGGDTIQLLVRSNEGPAHREQVEKVLINAGLHHGDFAVRELGRPGEIKIYFSPHIASYIPTWNSDVSSDSVNSKLGWLVSTMEKGEFSLAPASSSSLSDSWTSVGGQFSDVMRTQASWGIVIALVTIMGYITLRFNGKAAIAAVVALLFDLLATFACIVILSLAGVPLTIDLNTIAAMLTILGFSLNDTIIVFDRIRDETKSDRRSPICKIANHSLNITLSRTLMTSGITLLVLLIMVFIGGVTLLNFSLVMAIGVIIGTASSFFVATYLLTSLENPKKLIFWKKDGSSNEKANGEAL